MSDDTTQIPVAEEQGQAPSTENKPWPIPYDRFKEKVDEANSLKEKLQETEAKIQQEKAQVELKMSQEMYGEIVLDQSVQEYKTKYPDLTYKQIFAALEIDVPTQYAGHSPTPWRSIGTMSWTTWITEYKVSELGNIQAKDPKEYKRIMDDYASGKAKVVPW